MDDDHVIISIRGILEYLVGVASFVDRDLLEPGVSVLVNSLVGIALLPSRSVDVRGGNRAGEHQQLRGCHARRKAPVETYADIGGLDEQIMEIKVQQCHAFYL